MIKCKLVILMFSLLSRQFIAYKDINSYFFASAENGTKYVELWCAKDHLQVTFHLQHFSDSYVSYLSLVEKCIKDGDV